MWASLVIMEQRRLPPGHVLSTRRELGAKKKVLGKTAQSDGHSRPLMPQATRPRFPARKPGVRLSVELLYSPNNFQVLRGGAALHFILASLGGYYFISTDLICNPSRGEPESGASRQHLSEGLLVGPLPLHCVPQQRWE